MVCIAGVKSSFWESLDGSTGSCGADMWSTGLASDWFSSVTRGINPEGVTRGSLPHTIDALPHGGGFVWASDFLNHG